MLLRSSVGKPANCLDFREARAAEGAGVEEPAPEATHECSRQLERVISAAWMPLHAGSADARRSASWHTPGAAAYYSTVRDVHPLLGY